MIRSLARDDPSRKLRRLVAKLADRKQSSSSPNGIILTEHAKPPHVTASSTHAVTDSPLYTRTGAPGTRAAPRESNHIRTSQTHYSDAGPRRAGRFVLLRLKNHPFG